MTLVDLIDLLLLRTLILGVPEHIQKLDPRLFLFSIYPPFHGFRPFPTSHGIDHPGFANPLFEGRRPLVTDSRLFLRVSIVFNVFKRSLSVQWDAKGLFLPLLQAGNLAERPPEANGPCYA
jgi:hypothetical protein